ncbi:TBC1 domain family member 30 [Aplochiton taeniatus]
MTTQTEKNKNYTRCPYENGVQVPYSELSEIDIDLCDGNICSEEESGVFVNSGASVADDFSGFQRWSTKDFTSECSNDTSSPQTCSPECAHIPNSNELGIIASVNPGRESESQGNYHPRTSIVDGLLVELYETYSSNRRSVDSLDSSTEASSSEAFLGRSNSGSNFLQELQEKHTRRHQINYLAQKGPEELRWIIQEAKYRTGLQSAKLLRQLKRRDRLCNKQQKNYDIITACLQAVSQKRRVDTRLKFTIEPSLGKNGFQQWYDALKAVARLPTGIPKEWRKRVWLTLADQYLHSISIDWDKTLRFAFNERSNPDDDSLGIQIVKDLHRTGCSSYSGQEGEQDRVVLKRVLLAYARWNKSVGYCQGFNVLAALILEVTEGNESDALKVMIYLIDKVLPESYFANNLRALSVDMAVFRDLLRLKLPRLSQHLHHLQKAANREAGGSYEPPLTNVFTMQWFLTMFATCLPPPTVLKIWDSVFFEGSEVLLRVALAIWESLGQRIVHCPTADEFYSTMGGLTQEMLEHSLIDPADLMQEVYSMAAFPFPQLAELREKYTYNITPFPTSVKTNGSGSLGGWDSDDDADMDDEDSMVTALGCLGPLGGLLAPELQRYQKHLKDQRGEQGNIGELSPGAVSAVGLGGSGRADHQAAINSMMDERMSTDISALKKQYSRIKRRQQQQATQLYIRTDLLPGPGPGMTTIPGVPQEPPPKPNNDKCPATSVLASQLNPSTPVVNHLLLGRRPRGGPRGSRPGLPRSTAPGLRPSPLPQRLGSPLRAPGGSYQTGSPWRSHVRTHRRNVARARVQLGFGDSEEMEEDEDKDEGLTSKTERRLEGEEEESRDRKEDTEGTAEEEENEDSEEEVTQNEESSCPPVSSSLQDSCGRSEAGEEIQQVEEGLASLELQTGSEPYSPTDIDPDMGTASSSSPGPALEPIVLPPPSPSAHRKESDSSSSESYVGSVRCSPSTPATLSTSSTLYIPASPSTASLTSTASTPSTPMEPFRPQQAKFSPFPSVKQPRKSTAARNLGLYGPTARTPTVHFPQLSRNLNPSTSTATPRRR